MAMMPSKRLLYRYLRTSYLATIPTCLRSDGSEVATDSETEGQKDGALSSALDSRDSPAVLDDGEEDGQLSDRKLRPSSFQSSAENPLAARRARRRSTLTVPTPVMSSLTVVQEGSEVLSAPSSSYPSPRSASAAASLCCASA